MKDFKIKASNFIDWYFNTGADQDQESSALELGRQMIEQLINVGQGSVTVQDIVDGCEMSCIPLKYVEGYDESAEGEISDLELAEFTITVIN